MRKHASQRRGFGGGFSLIELCVVLTIVGTLISLTLVGVQQARQMSRSSTCASRLHQLGLSIQLYESQHGWLPSSSTSLIDAGGLVVPQEAPHSLASGYWRLLPSLEQKSIAARAKRELDMLGGSRPLPHQVAHEPISALACPSDGVSGGNNYRFSAGPVAVGSTLAVSGHDPSKHDALFGYFRKRLSDVVGGLSHTVAMSERLRSNDRGFNGRRDIYVAPLYFFDLGSDAMTIEELVDRMADRIEESPPEHYCADAGRYWHRAGLVFVDYNHQFMPNAPVSGIAHGSLPALRISRTGAVGASSGHRDGVWSVRLDGSGHFVTDSVDCSIWRRLASVSKSGRFE